MQAPQVGEVLGRYRIEREVGRGGMGVVLAATDTRLGRTVALKVITGPHTADPQFRQRFEDEAAMLARIDSPFVVRLLDHDSQGPSPYLVTQYVDGTDLARHVRSLGPLPARDALALCAQVARGLGAAHRAGIVHRDLKLSNILVRDIGTPEQHAYVCDFGIARGDGLPRRTAAGVVVGSWTNLAPERTEGTPATPASDIYALGCVLWTCLTGTPPYSGSEGEVALAHAQAPVPQLPGADAFTARLNALLARMLAKHPAARPADAGEVRDELERLVAAAPLSPSAAARPTIERPLPAPPAPPAAPPPPPSLPPLPDPLFRRRRRWPWAVAALAVVVVAAGATGTGLALRDDEDPPARAAADGDAVTGDLDGDGFGDLAVLELSPPDTSDFDQPPGHLEPHTRWRLLSDGGSFGERTEASAPAPTSWPNGVGTLTHADVDGDGRADQVWTTIDEDDQAVVDVIPAEGDPWHASWSGEGWSNQGRPLVVDLSQDGRPDLVYLNEFHEDDELVIDVAVAKGDGFAEPKPWLKAPGYASTELYLRAGDVDGEGHDDIVMQVTRSGSAAILLQTLTSDGKALRREGTEQRLDVTGYTRGIMLITDIDGDDADELVLAGRHGLAARRLTEGVLAESTPLWTTTPDQYRDWRFRSRDYQNTYWVSRLWQAADVDGDGDSDLVNLFPQPDGFALEVYRSEGGALAAPVTWGTIPCGPAGSDGERCLDNPQTIEVVH
ncbi:serine/threonine-protein kinase [Nocardioides sp. QY071]|uniref:serine/threonine-protein kinase n=1 Tax=Nocardioides sp. QY071 TaxID=3044187 RepID=UPI00249A12FE|nr:serine/threonine-protein kinase [Nocardioides sp. QY071]WGY01392.1 serine/threonine-protein kinase [Nocardioides sp. QY071]